MSEDVTLFQKEVSLHKEGLHRVVVTRSGSSNPIFRTYYFVEIIPLEEEQYPPDRRRGVLYFSEGTFLGLPASLRQAFEVKTVDLYLGLNCRVREARPETVEIADHRNPSPCSVRCNVGNLQKLIAVIEEVRAVIKQDRAQEASTHGSQTRAGG